MESKEKQNDFNKIKDTNAFLQNTEKHQIEQNKNKVKHSEHTEGKKIAKDQKQHSQNKEDKRKTSKKSLKKATEQSDKTIGPKETGQKLDVFI
ncbi:hypothetical protein [Clostridium aceticum]|nr:hypothetical protein [Clostridium aceticum]